MEILEKKFTNNKKKNMEKLTVFSWPAIGCNARVVFRQRFEGHGRRKGKEYKC